MGIRTDFFLATDERAVRDARLCESLPCDHFETLELGGITVDILDAIAAHLKGRAVHPEDPSALEVLSCGPDGPWINRVSDSFADLLLKASPEKIRDACSRWITAHNKALGLKEHKNWTEENVKSMTGAMREIADYLIRARTANCPLYMRVSL